jgi:hypothetical protein
MTPEAIQLGLATRCRRCGAPPGQACQGVALVHASRIVRGRLKQKMALVKL